MKCRRMLTCAMLGWLPLQDALVDVPFIVEKLPGILGQGVLVGISNNSCIAEDT